MSKFRTIVEAKKANPELFELKQGPNGRNLCRMCEIEVSPPRRTFCSKECVHEYNIHANPRYARKCVIKRDNGICAHCGIDCIELRRVLRLLPINLRKQEAVRLRIPLNRLYTCLFDVDHINPVYNGGGWCDLQNLQTLCIPCHKIKTSKEANERKMSRS